MNITTEVNIIVQGIDEMSFEFSDRLNEHLSSLANTIEVNDKTISINFTTDSNGRQTANITYQLNKS